MSDYSKITDYAAKDALLTGDPLKKIKGTEIGADFDAVSTAIATKYDSSNVGSAIQAYSANLDEYAAVNPTVAGLALLDDADAAAQRTTLGLGTLATQNGTFSGTSSGTNTGDQTITLTGNVTGSGTGSFAATIANDAVTYAKMQNVSATDKLLGRSTAGSGDVEEIACTAAGRALLDDADATAQRVTLGLVIGTNVQAYDADLAALAGLTSAANKVPMFSGSGTATLLDFKDEDNMASNSATAVPSQQSVKAYVDASVSGGITIGTQQAATSGTAITFGGIPAGTKRITVMFDELSTNTGATSVLLRLGDSGGIETTGYVSYTTGTTSATDGFLVTDESNAADKRSGIITLALMDAATFKWVASGSIGASNTPTADAIGGVKSLSAELTQISITTAAGTATFDNGSINIQYE